MFINVEVREETGTPALTPPSGRRMDHTSHNKAVDARVYKVCVPELVPGMIVPAVHHTDSQNGDEASPTSIFAPGKLALDRLDAAQLEVLLHIGVATAEPLIEKKLKPLWDKLNNER